MASPLLKALSSGFTSKQVIDYLLKKFPDHADKIKEALGYGFTADQVIQKLTNSSKKGHIEANHATEYGKLRSIDSEARQSRQNSALSAGALAASSLAAPLAAGALQRALPNSLSGMIPALTSQLQPKTQSLEPPLDIPPEAQAPVNPVSPNIAQVGQNLQPEVKSINVSDVLENLGSKKKVDELIKSGNDAGGVAGYFKKFHPKIAKDIEDKAGKDFENVIAEYIAGPKEQKVSEMIAKESKPEEPQKIEKKSTVASPQGVGEVLEIRNGQAIVDVDGKKHKVPVEELIESPMPEKELADLYDDLISGIEKKSGQQVSRNVEWAGYDPKTNELAYKPHGSDKLYAYDDISPEDVEELTSLLTQRKTTGDNYIGAWEAGTTSPIGAALHKLIMKLQAARGGKGNEYKNRYETIYDALELAKKEAKARHAERKKQAKKSTAR